MKYLIIGSNGRLGSQIFNSYASEGVISIPRGIYNSWQDRKNLHSIKQYFKLLIESEDAILFIASGLLDPRKCDAELNQINYFLPKNIIEATKDLDLRVITFGTIMEKYEVRNSYLDSKKLLRNYIDEVSYPAEKLTHIMLHTLYGVGMPSEFMFLGQIYHALKNDVQFEMSTGEQYREYHHVMDDVKAINLLVKEPNITPVVDLSHGNPVTLRDLAQHVFNRFRKMHLLNIGVYRYNEKEVFTPGHARAPFLSSKIKFRNTFEGVEKYLEALINRDLQHG